MSVRWPLCTESNTTILLILCREVFFSIGSLWSVWYSKRSHSWYNSFEVYYCPDRTVRTVASKLAKILVQFSRTRQIDINVPESWNFSLSTSSRHRIWTRFRLYLVGHTCRMITVNIPVVAVHVDSRAKTVLPFCLHCLPSVSAWPGCHELQKSNWLGKQRRFTHLLVVLARQKGVRWLGISARVHFNRISSDCWLETGRY